MRKYKLTLLFIVISIIPIWNTGITGLLTNGDTFFPYFPNESLYRLAYTWDGCILMGKDNTIVLPCLPLHAVIAGFSWAGLDLSLINRIWFLLPLLLLATSMYYLTSALYQGKGRVEASILATLFFVFNPLVKDHLVGGSIKIMFARAIGVFLLALIIRGLESPNKGRYFIAIPLTFIFLALNPIVGSINVLLCISFIVFYLFCYRSERQKLDKTIKFLIGVGFLTLLVNLWYILPVAVKLLNVDIVTECLGTGGGKDILDSTKESTNFRSVLRLMYGYNTSFAHPIFAYERTFIGPFCTLLVVLCAYSTLLFIPFRQMAKVTQFFYLLAVTATLFATGTNNYFLILFQWFWENIPLFSIFRNPIKFTYLSAIAYAYLLGLFWLILRERLEQRISRRFVQICYASCIGVVLVGGWPLLTGNLLGFLKPVHIPKYYDQVREMLPRTGNGTRTLILPNHNWYTQYKWSPYDMQDIAIDYFFAPVISNFPGRTKFVKDNPEGIIYKGLDNNEGREYSDLINETLRRTAVNYILVHKDTTSDVSGIHELCKSLNDLEGVRHDKSFGGLEFYSVVSPLPKIYATGNNYNVCGDYNLDALHALALSGIYKANERPVFNFFKDKSLMDWKSEGTGQRPIKDAPILLLNKEIKTVILDLATPENHSTVDRKTPINIKLNDNAEASFEVKEGGDFEVWIRDKTQPPEVRRQDFLYIGEMEFPLPFYNNKWIKLADVKLQELTYDVRLVSKEGAHNPEIVVVPAALPRTLLNKFADSTSGKPLSYFFYVDTLRTRESLKVAENLPRTDKENVNPFSISTKRFYLPRGSGVSVKAYIRPKRIFVPEEHLTTVVTAGAPVSPDATADWNVSSKNVHFKQILSEEGLQIKVFFAGRQSLAEEGLWTKLSFLRVFFAGRRSLTESVVLTKEFSNLRLRDNQYLSFSHLIENPTVQHTALEIYFSDEKGKTLDKHITWCPKDKVDAFNLYETLVEILTKRHIKRAAVDGLYIKKVNIIFEKITHVKAREDYYTFTFRDIAFSNWSPIIVNFEDTQFTHSDPAYFYCLNEKGETKKVRFVEEAPYHVRYLSKLSVRKVVDLKQSPVLVFSFRKPAYGRTYKKDAEPIGFPQQFKVLLALDFDGDEKQDAEAKLLLPAVPKPDSNLCYINVDAYEEVKKRFPDKSHYNLLKLGLGHPNDKNVLFQELVGKDNVTHKEHIYRPSDFETGTGMLKIDNKLYRLPGDYEKHKGKEPYCIIDYEEIPLKKGYHILEVMDNEKYKVEMVEIKLLSETRQIPLASSQSPEINFRRIDPTRYIVDVEGAKGPFTLVFSENFNPGWKAYIRQKPGGGNQKSDKDPETDSRSALLSAWTDRGKRVEIKDHFVVNRYANGWIIPAVSGQEIVGQESDVAKKGMEGENLQIVLEYEPQRVLELAVLISCIALLGCIGYLGYDEVRRKKSAAKDN